MYIKFKKDKQTKFLKEIKEKMGLSLRGFAKKLNISKSTIQDYFNERSKINYKTFMALTKLGRVNPNKINYEFVNSRNFNKESYLTKIKDYVSTEIKKGHHPSYAELKEQFHLDYRKITLKEIYPSLGICFLELNCKRPNSSLKLLKTDLIQYLKKENETGHSPSRRELESKFGLRLNDILTGGIKGLYRAANLPYKQEINQELKYRKAQLFKRVIIKILPKLKFKLLLERTVYERGIDLIVLDERNRIIGLELKAYNCFENVKQRNINQIKRLIKKEKLDFAYLFTTTNKLQNKMRLSKKLKILTFKKLTCFCNKNQLDILNNIRNSSVNYTPIYKINKKEKICNYVKTEYNKGKTVGHREIAKALKLHPFTYFNNIYEIYKASNIPIPLKKIRDKSSDIYQKEKIKFIDLILIYVKKEIEKGHYPSGIDINKEFKLNIGDLISMSGLYKKINEKGYQERRKSDFNAP